MALSTGLKARVPDADPQATSRRNSGGEKQDCVGLEIDDDLESGAREEREGEAGATVQLPGPSTASDTVLPAECRVLGAGPVLVCSIRDASESSSYLSGYSVNNFTHT